MKKCCHHTYLTYQYTKAGLWDICVRCQDMVLLEGPANPKPTYSDGQLYLGD